MYINLYKLQLLTITVIQAHVNVKLRELSGGNRSFVESLLLIYSDSKCILLDELFSQLLLLIANQLNNHILKFKNIKGFIVKNHYYRQILEVSTRVVLIHNGYHYLINNEDDLILNGYLFN